MRARGRFSGRCGEELFYSNCRKIRFTFLLPCDEQVEYAIDLGFDSVRDSSPTYTEQMLPDQKDIFVPPQAIRVSPSPTV